MGMVHSVECGQMATAPEAKSSNIQIDSSRPEGNLYLSGKPCSEPSKLNDQHYGPYSSQADAIRNAVDAAHQTGKNGGNAQVLVQGENHQFRTEWTYGNDPWPPKG